MTATTPGALAPLLAGLGPEWRYAGDVAIDSGGLLVIDASGPRPDDWALDRARAISPYGPVGWAVHCSTGLGDGLYPVVVRVVNLPGFGERVAELRVLFFPDLQAVD